MQAQGYNQLYIETVYLKNGSIVSGELIEQIPEKSVKIKTRDGNIFAYELREIEKITRKRVESTHNIGPQVGYKGFFDFGFTFGTGDYGADKVEFSTSHGYQINSFLFLGIGAGLNLYTQGSPLLVSLPIFADTRLTYPTKALVAPFLDVKIGYTTSKHIEGFYFAPSVGARFDLQKNTAINFSVGYSLQNSVSDYYYSYNYGGYSGTTHYTQRNNIGGVTLKLGFEF